jgi:hypothetical protein
MSTFTPSPEFDYYYKACRKGDPEAKAVAVSYSAPKSESVKRASILRADLDNHMILIMWSIGGIEGLSPSAAGHA